MKFGITPTTYSWDNIPKFEQWGTIVEELGFDSILVPDHFQLPVPPFLSNELMDSWTTLSYISAKTSMIRLGSLVSPIPRYIPSQLAKIIANVDLLSNGRVIAGFGVGYCPEEFVNYSPFFAFDENRILFEKFKEGLQIILKLWTEDKVTFNGKHYTLSNAVLLPKPIQKPHPPLWAGGMGTQMLKIIAKFFDGWIPPAIPQRISNLRVLQSPHEYEKCMKTIQTYLKDYGRDMIKFTFGILLRFSVDMREIRKASEIIESYKNAGSRYIVIEFAPLQMEKYIELTKKFGEEIIPSFT